MSAQFDGSIQFIGTATVLIRFGGYSILTDPNFLHQGDHVHLGFGLFSTRLTNPALEMSQLPALDMVVVSHLHRDHFDQVVEKRLDREVEILAPSSAARTLRRKGFQNAAGLEPWKSIEFVKEGALPLKITAMPAKHAPGLMSQIMPDVMGSLLEYGSEDPFRIYISGDTLLYEGLEEIPRRVPHLDLALLHLGGTRILGILVTMDATMGVETVKKLNPDRVIPIHYNDYPVFKSRLEEFQAAARVAGLDSKVHVLRHGDTFSFHYQAKEQNVVAPLAGERRR